MNVETQCVLPFCCCFLCILLAPSVISSGQHCQRCQGQDVCRDHAGEAASSTGAGGAGQGVSWSSSPGEVQQEKRCWSLPIPRVHVPVRSPYHRQAPCPQADLAQVQSGSRRERWYACRSYQSEKCSGFHCHRQLAPGKYKLGTEATDRCRCTFTVKTDQDTSSRWRCRCSCCWWNSPKNSEEIELTSQRYCSPTVDLHSVLTSLFFEETVGLDRYLFTLY